MLNIFLTKAAAQSMAYDLSPVLETGKTTLVETLTQFLPIILPVAITLGLFWVGYRFFRRGGR